MRPNESHIQRKLIRTRRTIGTRGTIWNHQDRARAKLLAICFLHGSEQVDLLKMSVEKDLASFWAGTQPNCTISSTSWPSLEWLGPVGPNLFYGLGWLSFAPVGSCAKVVQGLRLEEMSR